MPGSSAKKIGYVLNRDAAESERLERQHRNLVKVVGSFADPSLGDLSQFKCILDNATGTSVWACAALAGGTEGVVVNLSEEATVEGADVSDAQFYAREKRDPKLSLFVHNITKPLSLEKQKR